jgi:tetratricopeptide (TPR) repeat protein
MRNFSFSCLILLAAVFFFFYAASEAAALPDQEEKAKSLAYYTMGVVYDMQGSYEKALGEFEKSAQFDDNYAVHLRMGADYARLERLPEAVEELKIALKYDPANIQARYLLAIIYSAQKDFDKAAGEYESILTSFAKAEPENIEVYGYLGQLYYSQKQYDKAIAQFEIILSLENDNADVIFLLGSLYLEKGDRAKAIELFLKAIALDPENDGCLNSLGYVYAEEGANLDEAKKLIEKALSLDPKNGAYLDSLGWVYYKKGEYEKALTYLKEADSYLKDPVIYEHLGDVYARMGQTRDAKKYWKLSLELLPAQAKVLEKVKSVE